MHDLTKECLEEVSIGVNTQLDLILLWQVL